MRPSRLESAGPGHRGRRMDALHRTGGLLRRAVTYRDIRLGVVEDVLFDGALGRLVGLDVRCGDGAHRFLPFPACELVDGRLAVESALVFLERDLDFYRRGGRSLSDLVGEPVRRRGAELGPLADLLVTADGDVRRFVAASSGGERELDAGPGLWVGNHALRPAV